MHAIRKLENWLVYSERCKLVYMAALMGRGKTDLALTFLQTIWWHYERLRESDHADDVPVPEFAANFRVDAGDDTDVALIQNYDRLTEWGERGSSDDVRWFIFDEASTELTAQSGKNAQDVAELFAPFVKKMRKQGVNMIIVGHDRGDVHVAIRSMADFVDKTGLKSASFYAGIKKREPHGHLLDVEGIPPTSWGFNTDDMAEWSWGSAQEDVDAIESDVLRRLVAHRAARLAEVTDISQEKAAEAVSTSNLRVTQTMVSRAKRGEYDTSLAGLI